MLAEKFCEMLLLLSQGCPIGKLMHVDGNCGHIPLTQEGDVAVGLLSEFLGLPSEPIRGAVLRLHMEAGLLRPPPLSLTRELKTAHNIVNGAGEVDIQKRAPFERMFKHIFYEGDHIFFCDVEIGFTPILTRESEPWNASKNALDHRSNRPRVKDVATRVGACVDAGDDEVGFLIQNDP